jgi:hypothetical protein
MKDERRLTSLELEALAHGRRDLVTDHAQRIADDDPEFAAQIENEHLSSRDMSVALKRANPDLPDLDSMIARAMEKAPLEKTVKVASRFSLLFGGAFGIAVAMTCGAISISRSGDLGSIAEGLWNDASSLIRFIVTSIAIVDRMVRDVPGGWASLALGGFAIFSMLALPLRALMRSIWRPHPVMRGGLGILLVCLAHVGTARAYEIEGSWPEPDPAVSIDIDHAPLSEALRVAASSAELGLVYSLPTDPAVTLHVRDVPLREVLDALLDGVPARVRHAGHILSIRPVTSAPVPDVAPLARSETRTEARPTPDTELEDIITFGGNGHVPADRQVRDVLTVGGNARIDGHVWGDVLTMGGNVEIHGTVVGDIWTMGGNIEIAPEARVLGQFHTMGGNVSNGSEGTPSNGSASANIDVHTKRQIAHANRGDDDDGDEDEEESWTSELLDSIIRYALIFLLGLLVMGFAPERHSTLQVAVAKLPLRALAAGFLGVIAGAILTLVLVITIIGIPAALVLALGLFLSAYVGLAIAGSVIGAVLPIESLRDRPVLQLGVGVAILFVISQAPILGGVLIIGATLIGLGAVLLTRFGQREPTGD